MSYKIIDLHCDLLGYLECHEGKEAALHEESHCSIPLLKKGNVALQTLAIFTETKEGSVQSAKRQLALYNDLLKDYKGDVAPFAEFHEENKRVHFILAIENGSGILDEKEPFDLLFERLELFQEYGGPLLYVSLTWKTENRFGGGDDTKVGLKREGEVFLELLSDQNISIDLSHTSDALADDILNYIHKKNLKLVPIASHSNFRHVLDCPRNLSDPIAKEIIALGGIIGINFVRRFVGDQRTDFLSHIRHGIELGGEKALCLGADFFGGLALPKLENLKPFFQTEFSDSSCYQRFLELLETEFSREEVNGIAHENMEIFLRQKGFNHI